MAEHIVHEENSSMNAIIAVLLILAVLIIGFFLFRNGVPGITGSGTNINGELPSAGGSGGATGGTGGDQGGTQY